MCRTQVDIKFFRMPVSSARSSLEEININRCFHLGDTNLAESLLLEEVVKQNSDYYRISMHKSNAEHCLAVISDPIPLA